jgi:hypothetical protein
LPLAFWLAVAAGAAAGLVGLTLGPAAAGVVRSVDTAAPAAATTVTAWRQVVLFGLDLSQLFLLLLLLLLLFGLLRLWLLLLLLLLLLL